MVRVVACSSGLVQKFIAPNPKPRTIAEESWGLNRKWDTALVLRVETGFLKHPGIEGLGKLTGFLTRTHRIPFQESARCLYKGSVNGPRGIQRVGVCNGLYVQRFSTLAQKTPANTTPHIRLQASD